MPNLSKPHRQETARGSWVIPGRFGHVIARIIYRMNMVFEVGASRVVLCFDGANCRESGCRDSRCGKHHCLLLLRILIVVILAANAEASLNAENTDQQKVGQQNTDQQNRGQQDVGEQDSAAGVTAPDVLQGRERTRKDLDERRVETQAFSAALSEGDSPAPEDERWAQAAIKIRDQFQLLDQNHDLSLELLEYVQASGDGSSESVSKQVRTRDFQLFDFDQNHRLSFREFSAIPGLVEAPFRGSSPDPFASVLSDAVAALDESYDRWDQRPHELISAHSFVGNFLGSIMPMGNRFVTGRVIDLADLNLDGKVGRQEAKHFLEQQLGIRLREGRALRDPTGRVVRYDWFLKIDQNRDGRLDQDEVNQAKVDLPEVSQRFVRLDQDADQQISYDEFSHPLTGCYFDPITWFLSADTNLDGRVALSECLTQNAAGDHEILKIFFRAFDTDYDAVLTLNEYRISPLGNRNYPWQDRLVDESGDGQISYGEYTFDAVDLFRLQRRLYFHRMDLDFDGALSTNECSFTSILPITVVRCRDQNPAEIIIKDADFKDLGSIHLHPDGGSVLMYQSPYDQSMESKIVRLSLKDQSRREICDGRFPTWSPDGHSFVCERSRRGQSVWLMEPSGLSGRKLADGRAPALSADGTFLAYIHEHGVWLYHRTTGERKNIFRRDEHRHRDLGDRLQWSPDGRSIVLIGHSADQSDLFVIRLAEDGVVKKVDRFALPDSNVQVFSWCQGDEVLLRHSETQPNFTRLTLFDVQTGIQRPPRADLFGGIDFEKSEILSGQKNHDGAWYLSVHKN